jgi:type IV pilus assembly protein PilW
MRHARSFDHAAKQRQRGLSLIELMISLTIGMAIVTTIGYVYLGAAATFRSLDASSRIQENVRFAFERMSYDIRMAGFTGCAFRTAANVLNNPNDWAHALFTMPLAGFEAGSTFPTGVPTALRGDALSVLRADTSREYIIDSHNPNSAQFQLKANHDIKQGELLIATDCQHAALFQMTNVNNNNTIATVNHNTGNATSPGNCTKGFGLPIPNPCTTNGTAYTFSEGSRLFRLSAATYFVMNKETDNAKPERPALFRQAMRFNSSGNEALVSEELVDGIADMQLLYGVDTTATADGTVDTYVTAADVATTAPGANDQERWARVLSVQIDLLAVSKPDQQVVTEPQSYFYNGATVTPTDRLMRKAFTTTVSVRNRL